jgi:exonuclease V
MQLTVDAHSDYGSDIQVRTPTASEYGSEFDAEEETLIGDLLTQISTTAPTEKTVIYRSGAQDDASPPTVLLHSSPPSAVVHLATDATVELSPRRAQRSPSVEVEYDSPSREAWSGTVPSSCITRVVE